PGAAGGEEMPQHELERLVVELEEEMIAAAEELRFEYAAQLRDELRELRRDLQEIQAQAAPVGPAAAVETSEGDIA
ncbi:MAG TPA: UvrB/UvrC motif-containing protein, partial [Solirubrobacteraceae bacterium]|nr:UvrB/UvrC motif-containing protein [Solirubrobacteraceae bacterium]